MDIRIKTFDELSKTELYEILRERTAVFIVEQECAYQEVDDKDQVAVHVMGREAGDLIAYTRIFKAGDYASQACIGRVLVHRLHRNKGLGQEIMKASLEVVKKRFKTDTVMVSAQRYLEKFYQELGFQTTGEPYLEDGIPHIKMVNATF